MRQQCEPLALCKYLVKLLSKRQHEDSWRRNLKDEGLCPHLASSAGPVEFDGKRRLSVHRSEDYDPFRLYAGVEIGLRLGNIEPERIPVRVHLLRTLDNFCVATRYNRLSEGGCHVASNELVYRRSLTEQPPPRRRFL